MCADRNALNQFTANYPSDVGQIYYFSFFLEGLFHKEGGKKTLWLLVCYKQGCKQVKLNKLFTFVHLSYFEHNC